MRKQKEAREKTDASGARRRCTNPGCRRPADDSWGRAENLCPDCALGRDLFDRGERRERIFAGAE